MKWIESNKKRPEEAGWYCAIDSVGNRTVAFLSTHLIWHSETGHPIAKWLDESGSEPEGKTELRQEPIDEFYGNGATRVKRVEPEGKEAVELKAQEGIKLTLNVDGELCFWKTVGQQAHYLIVDNENTTSNIWQSGKTGEYKTAHNKPIFEAVKMFMDETLNSDKNVHECDAT